MLPAEVRRVKSEPSVMQIELDDDDEFHAQLKGTDALVPPSLSHHTATLIDNAVYIIGGRQRYHWLTRDKFDSFLVPRLVKYDLDEKKFTDLLPITVGSK
jgi:hypothetical protein